MSGQYATYTIDLYDASTSPATFIRTIGPHSTSSGMIQEDWNVKYADDVTPFTGNTVDAVFNVTLQDAPGGTATQSGSGKKLFNRPEAALTEWGPTPPYFDVMYVYMPDDNLHGQSEFAKNGQIWNAMQDVVNVLIRPNGLYVPYNSTFNGFDADAYPGYVTRRKRKPGDLPTLPSIEESLLPSLNDEKTKNFFAYTHGSHTQLGDGGGEVYLDANKDVSLLLKNGAAPTGGYWYNNPYRFVFLPGCSTSSKDWQQAFGIQNLLSEAYRDKIGPQAFVGYQYDHVGGLAISTKLYSIKFPLAYIETLRRFFLDWMTEKTLYTCICNATNSSLRTFPFPVPENYRHTITIDGDSFQIRETSAIFVSGHSGLTVYGLDPHYDGQFFVHGRSD